MKDFVLEASFLRSSVDLPMKVRKEIASQLEVFSRNPRNRDLDLERLEGSKQLHALRIDSGQRIILRLDKAAATLLFVETDASVYSRSRNHQPRVQERIIAPVEALETLLVQEKSELEKIINAHLPPEARQFPNWWANQKSGKRPQAFAWMAVGWIVIKADVKAGRVRMKNMEIEAAG
jgi:hypothetical protein